VLPSAKKARAAALDLELHYSRSSLFLTERMCDEFASANHYYLTSGEKYSLSFAAGQHTSSPPPSRRASSKRQQGATFYIFKEIIKMRCKIPLTASISSSSPIQFNSIQFNQYYLSMIIQTI